MKEIINNILEESNDSIIIIQGDTGAQISMQPDNEDFQRKRLSILLAYHIPNDTKNLLYENITPVNTYRIIFNNYFNADFELLDDKNYWLYNSEDSNVENNDEPIGTIQPKILEQDIYTEITDLIN